MFKGLSVTSVHGGIVTTSSRHNKFVRDIFVEIHSPIAGFYEMWGEGGNGVDNIDLRRVNFLHDY